MLRALVSSELATSFPVVHCNQISTSWTLTELECRKQNGNYLKGKISKSNYVKLKLYAVIRGISLPETGNAESAKFA